MKSHGPDLGLFVALSSTMKIVLFVVEKLDFLLFFCANIRKNLIR